MCILYAKTGTVEPTQTSIAAWPIEDNRWVVVYANRLSAGAVMILPVLGHKVRVYDTTKDEMGTFFARLHAHVFPPPKIRSMRAVMGPSAALQMSRVGNYTVTVANEKQLLEDLAAPNSVLRAFSVTQPEIASVAARYRAHGARYLVCRYEGGAMEGQSEPLMWSAETDTCLLPTYHAGHAAHWDHDLYVPAGSSYQSEFQWVTGRNGPDISTPAGPLPKDILGAHVTGARRNDDLVVTRTGQRWLTPEAPKAMYVEYDSDEERSTYPPTFAMPSTPGHVRPR